MLAGLLKLAYIFGLRLSMVNAFFSFIFYKFISLFIYYVLGWNEIVVL